MTVWVTVWVTVWLRINITNLFIPVRWLRGRIGGDVSYRGGNQSWVRGLGGSLDEVECNKPLMGMDVC